MKIAFVIVCLTFMCLAGCAVLETISSQGPIIQEYGETAVEIGFVATAFQPQIGVLVVAIGGLAVALGKVLTLIKRKEQI